MLGLKLREEFQGKLLKGTAIELANDSKTGATQVGAQSFLGITYPTHDLVKAIEAIGPNQARPVVVIGERGAGKSHLLAALYHAVNDPVATRLWLEQWAKTINAPELAAIKLRTGMHVIGDSLHRQRYKFLWDVLLENHPHGIFIRGKWQGAGPAKTDILSHDLTVELLEKQPVMLLLDEFQTWFDGLANTEQQPTRAWAFTFIQILSEIAKERPDLLALVISVRNGGSDAYPSAFGPEYTPKALEAVANKAREPDDPDAFYQRLLTQCWREAHRILKPGGILAFTFHHSEDEPWVAVLESLFDAGFYLEATYPIRSDESKGEGEFGSKKIEYDIIHVCRKRTEAPLPVSWARMRREVLAEVRQLQAMLENHAKDGLPAADLHVIRRGKALEYFSRHYGQVFVDEGRAISVRDALAGIHGLIDEDTQRGTMPPPVNAEPMTRQFLRIFDANAQVKRDQMQKFLRGSGVTPDDFEQRGWCSEKAKVFSLVSPLAFATAWHGKHRRRLTADLDQALVLLGACHEGSGIAAADTLKNDNFKPHPALKALLEWFAERGADAAIKQAARRALAIYGQWAEANKPQVQQMQMFLDEALA